MATAFAFQPPVSVLRHPSSATGPFRVSVDDFMELPDRSCGDSESPMPMTMTQQQQQDNNNNNVDDVMWSIFSNLFFVGGGLFYIIGSVWDWSLDTTGSTIELDSHLLYDSIWILGPLVYLLNSFIDVTWALRTKQQEKSRRGIQIFYKTALEHAANVSVEGDSAHDINLALKKWDAHAKILEEDLIQGGIATAKQQLDNQQTQTQTQLLSRIRRHFGHRRELSAATAFGAAAIFGVASAIGSACGCFQDYELDINQLLDRISIHLYLLSAIFALCGRTPPPPPQLQLSSQPQPPWSFLEDTQTLENLGDALFGLASIIDVVLCDFHFDDNAPWWPVVSAILWLLDALLYLRADFVALYRMDNADANKGVDATIMVQVLEEMDHSQQSPGTPFEMVQDQPYA